MWGRSLFFIFTWTIEMTKEKYLNQLLEVIGVLRGPESDVARKHLQAYESNHTVNRRKMFELYKFIKINEIRDYDKLKKRISPDSTDDSFNKLIRRTIERVQESLIVDVNIRRKGSYSDIFRVKFFLRKQLMQAQILMGRGLSLRSLELYSSILRNAKKFELYDVVLEALYYKQLIQTNSVGSKYFEDIEREIEYYEDCRQFLRSSQKLRAKLTSQGIVKSQSLASLNDFEERIEQLVKYFEQTKSSNIQSIYYLLKMDLERAKGNSVHLLIKEFIVLLETSPAIYSKVRISYMNNELAVALLNELRFVEAKNSLEGFDKQDGSFALIDVIIIITHFKIIILLGELGGIASIVGRLEVRGVFEKFKLQSSIIVYYQSVSKFLQRDYSDSLQLLQSKNEIEKDKEGWNVWIRIMRLLCSIEMLKLNLIDYDIESFRKYLERTSKQFEVRERDKLVLRVLMDLDRSSYDFKLTSKEVEADLQKLKSTDKKYAWNPDSPELILFHDWFECKRLNKDYKPNFEIYREAMRKD